jgi:hypothetical protein
MLLNMENESIDVCKPLTLPSMDLNGFDRNASLRRLPGATRVYILNEMLRHSSNYSLRNVENSLHTDTADRLKWLHDIAKA